MSEPTASWPRGTRAATGGFWLAAAVSNAWRAGILADLGDDPQTEAELASRLSSEGPVNRRRLQALVRLLEVAAIVRTDPDGRLRVLDDVPVASPELTLDPRLVDVLLDPRFMWTEASTSDYFGSLTAEQEIGFALTMENQLAAACAAIPDLLEGRRHAVVVDIAGGTGAIASTLVERGAAGIGICLERSSVARELGRRRAHELSIDDRMTFVDFDLHLSVPPAGDLFVMSRVLHDWGDDECQGILDRARAALAPDGVLLVHEEILDRGAWWPAALDFFLAAALGDGRVRDLGQITELLGKSGFSVRSVADVDEHTSVVVAHT